MRSALVRPLRVSFRLVALLGLASTAHAATRFAANNGVDSPTCGATASPCRSITQTIANAAAGDTIQVRAGRYSADLDNDGVYGEPGEEVPAFGAMVAIYKPLIVLSTDGAAATILDARNVSANTNVLIVTGDAEFGRAEHGFLVTNTANTDSSGIAPQGTNLKIRGNQIVNWGNGRTGIDAEALPYVILIEANQVLGWDTGIHTRAASQTANKNQVSLSSTVGVFAEGGTIAGNVVAGNNAGIRLASAADATGNAVHGNFVFGVAALSGFTGVIQKNNIFGNGGVGTVVGCPAGFRNWGLVNAGNAALPADHNFWGAATGPGALPADNVCDLNGATTTTPFATSRFSINPGFEP